MTCRICYEPTRTVLDFGCVPPANWLKDSKESEELRYPIVVEKCDACFNLQLRDCIPEDRLYGHYLYLTPDSSTLAAHYHFVTEWLFDEGYLKENSFVLEFGSNVGHFLKFLKPRVGRVLGIDPAANASAIARTAGIETICDFFAPQAAEMVRRRYGAPDLIVGRHCCAHNRDPHVMIGAAADLLRDGGYFVMENSYAPVMLENNEFDQIYHEHMFYYSIRSVAKLFEMHDLQIVDIAMTPIQGGSAVFVARRGGTGACAKDSVTSYLEREASQLSDDLLVRFAANVGRIRAEIRPLVEDLRARGKTVWLYGASAKGVSLVNYTGINDTHIAFCADSTPLKHGKFLPMSGIEVRPEEEALAARPDFFLLTAWNYKEEIVAKVRHSGNLLSQFILAVPFVSIF